MSGDQRVTLPWGWRENRILPGTSSNDGNIPDRIFLRNIINKECFQTVQRSQKQSNQQKTTNNEILIISFTSKTPSVINLNVSRFSTIVCFRLSCYYSGTGLSVFDTFYNFTAIYIYTIKLSKYLHTTSQNEKLVLILERPKYQTRNEEIVYSLQNIITIMKFFVENLKILEVHRFMNVIHTQRFFLLLKIKAYVGKV